MSLHRPTRFIRLLQADRTSEDPLRSSHATYQTKKNKNYFGVTDNVHLAFLT